MSWLVIALLTLGTAGQRLVGMFFVGSALSRYPTIARLGDLLPPAVVAALIAQLTFGAGSSIVVDARAAGLAIAGLLVWKRAPFVVVVLSAAATTALLRAVA